MLKHSKYARNANSPRRMLKTDVVYKSAYKPAYKRNAQSADLLLSFAFFSLFLELFQLGEAFAESFFASVGLGFVNRGADELRGQVLLRGVAARAVVVVFVAVAVAELFSDAGDGIAVGAWHGERSRLFHNRVGLHSREFEAVALGRKCQVNGEFVKCN